MKSSPSNPLFYKATEGIKYLFLVSLGALFLMELGMSLRWRLLSDSAFLHYVAYLINEHDFVPYRDIFEVNMPGTYIFHMAVGKMFGYSDLASRLVDVAWLTATLTVTWFVIKPIGGAVAFASSLLFGLIYLSAGPHMSLQRDVIAILPMAIAVLLVSRRRPNQSANLIHFLLGVFFALASLFKPHMAIGLPALIVYSCIPDTNGPKSVVTFIKPCIIGGIFALVGFLLMLTIPFLWIWRIGALSSFWEVFSSYVPLYSEMSRDFEFRGTFARVLNLGYHYIRFGGYSILLTTAMFGVYLVLTKSTSTSTKKLTVLLFSLSVLYSLYALIGGKLWSYHWMPCIYFASLGTAIVLFSPPLPERSHHPIILPLFAFIITAMTVTLLPAYDFAQQLLYSQAPEPPMDGRVDEIATYLNENVSPTDKVQPLAWISGAIHAMLISEAVVATPYITDFQFYHHVSAPYIQKLRKHFLTELERERPTFIIEVHETPKLSGLDTSYSFPELRTFIEQHYQKDYTGNGFDIFRRNDN